MQTRYESTRFIIDWLKKQKSKGLKLKTNVENLPNKINGLKNENLLRIVKFHLNEYEKKIKDYRSKFLIGQRSNKMCEKVNKAIRHLAPHLNKDEIYQELSYIKEEIKK